jgi:hypothetical protein
MDSSGGFAYCSLECGDCNGGLILKVYLPFEVIAKFEAFKNFNVHGMSYNFVFCSTMLRQGKTHFAQGRLRFARYFNLIGLSTDTASRNTKRATRQHCHIRQPIRCRDIASKMSSESANSLQHSRPMPPE